MEGEQREGMLRGGGRGAERFEAEGGVLLAGAGHGTAAVGGTLRSSRG